jgi:hypothetical protein
MENDMSENIENLILEHLKRFQSSQDRIEKTLEELVYRTGRVEMSIAGIKGEVAHSEENDAALSIRVDQINKRIDRIERRLEING